MKLRAPAVALALAVLWSVAGPGEAHTSMLGSSPRAGAVVPRLPPIVVLTFAGPILRVNSVRIVRRTTGANATRWLRLSRRSTRQVLVGTRPAKPGRYLVRWTVTSIDSHRVSGSFAFRVRR